MTITVKDLQLSQRARELRVRFSTDEIFQYSCYFLRQHSPSTARTDAIAPEVNIVAIEPVGHYAVKLVFDDGHNTGIYSWDYLYELGQEVASS